MPHLVLVESNVSSSEIGRKAMSYIAIREHVEESHLQGLTPDFQNLSWNAILSGGFLFLRPLNLTASFTSFKVKGC